MKKLLIVLLVLVTLGFVSYRTSFFGLGIAGGGAPPYLIEDLEPPEGDLYDWLRNWARPDGPPRVGLQVGHWKNEELPEELSRLIGSTGSSGGGKSEAEVALAIAELTKKRLEERGITVDLIPATVPPQYWADAFVSIHADGNVDWRTRGYKAASPRRDFSKNAKKLEDHIEEEYQKATGLPYDPNVSRNMRGYYAFAWWRYDHAVHPMTASVILETGFLTNPTDRELLINSPEVSANGLAHGILRFLESEGLLND